MKSKLFILMLVVGIFLVAGSIAAIVGVIVSDTTIDGQKLDTKTLTKLGLDDLTFNETVCTGKMCKTVVIDGTGNFAFQLMQPSGHMVADPKTGEEQWVEYNPQEIKANLAVALEKSLQRKIAQDTQVKIPPVQPIPVLAGGKITITGIKANPTSLAR